MTRRPQKRTVKRTVKRTAPRLLYTDAIDVAQAIACGLCGDATSKLRQNGPMRVCRDRCVGRERTARCSGELTEAQIAKRLGVSRGRVSQILVEAMAKLRTNGALVKLREDLRDQ